MIHNDTIKYSEMESMFLIWGGGGGGNSKNVSCSSIRKKSPTLFLFTKKLYEHEPQTWSIVKNKLRTSGGCTTVKCNFDVKPPEKKFIAKNEKIFPSRSAFWWIFKVIGK